ncbi:transposase [Deinococcus oregonensis]|uniref:Transposase n=1 Tax=Deinococcus oregonensis TaxID=1805970 RepID=A0ABV6AX21_9DEIO
MSVLRGELGVAEAARQHDVNESLIHSWKAQFLEAGRARLAGDRPNQGMSLLERENDRLKRMVAEKELELDIARKVRRL